MKHSLEVSHLSVQVSTKDGPLNVVNDVSFAVNKGQSLGIVGESGCGKTMTVRSILRLLPHNASITGGSVDFEGNDLTHLSNREIQKIRGGKIAMIFQEPMASLNPVYSIGFQIAEMIRSHTAYSKKEALDYAVTMLEYVGIPRPGEIVKEYPYQLSGGMCQRVMIAMAMSCNPEILIADEPTTALDVTTQAQIMELIQRLQQERQMSLLLITHDLGVIAETCQNVAVMYAGEVVEKSPTGQLFKNPKHPYTKALLASVPSMETKRDFLPYIKGTVPSLRDMPSGCRFAPRCEFARQLCFGQDPPLIDIDSESKARCWMHSKRWNEEEANK